MEPLVTQCGFCVDESDLRYAILALLPLLGLTNGICMWSYDAPPLLSDLEPERPHKRGGILGREAPPGRHYPVYRGAYKHINVMPVPPGQQAYPIHSCSIHSRTTMEQIVKFVKFIQLQLNHVYLCP